MSFRVPQRSRDERGVRRVPVFSNASCDSSSALTATCRRCEKTRPSFAQQLRSLALTKLMHCLVVLLIAALNRTGQRRKSRYHPPQMFLMDLGVDLSRRQVFVPEQVRDV